MNSIGKFFHLNENHTSFKTEFLAGLTTFVSMSYILFVNPAVLGASGMNKGALFTATALSAAFTCIVMGLVANYPIASAPTLLEIYILKTNPTPRIRRVVIVKIKPLIKKIFAFLKNITI